IHRALVRFPPRRSSDLDAVHVEGAAVDVGAGEGVLALAQAADQAAAVEFGLAFFLNKSELDGEPEEAAQALDVVGVLAVQGGLRSEEHTSELQSREKLV